MIRIFTGTFWSFAVASSQRVIWKPPSPTTVQAGLPVAIGEAKPPVPWARIFGSKDTWGTALAYFGFGYAATIFSTWFFIYLKEGRGFDMRSSAILGMLPFIATTSCCLAGGAVSDWLAARLAGKPVASERWWVDAGGRVERKLF